MILQEIKKIKAEKKDLRKFGFTVGTVIVLIPALLWLLSKSVYINTGIIIFFLLGLFLIISAVVIPAILKYPHKYWMALALVLGFIMSRIIVTLLFYLAVTPIGLLARLTGKKFIEPDFDKKSESYWELRPKSEYNKSQTEKQF